MVVDSSAVIAVLLGEPETEFFVRVLARAPKKKISVFNALESAIVIEAKKGEAGGRELDLLLHRAQIEIIAFNSDQVELARTAWRKYGKGNHSAGLNIGDCCAYALAKYSGEPLLFKGKDFSQTDIQAVIDN
ncbi:type II toxin-antitoxin system VapC family toxin [Thermodesulfobacteriota bacterium]